MALFKSLTEKFKSASKSYDEYSMKRKKKQTQRKKEAIKELRLENKLQREKYKLEKTKQQRSMLGKGKSRPAFGSAFLEGTPQKKKKGFTDPYADFKDPYS